MNKRDYKNEPMAKYDSKNEQNDRCKQDEKKRARSGNPSISEKAHSVSLRVFFNLVSQGAPIIIIIKALLVRFLET